jgi:hypothetical protein
MNRLAEVRQSDSWITTSLLIDIQAVKENARVLGLLVVPLVRESFVPKVCDHLHCFLFVLMFSSQSSLMLDYDAVDMWYSTVKNTDTIFSSNGVPSLRELYPLLFQLMSTHGDIIGITLRIVDSSLLLDAPYLLQVSCSSNNIGPTVKSINTYADVCK